MVILLIFARHNMLSVGSYWLYWDVICSHAKKYTLAKVQKKILNANVFVTIYLFLVLKSYKTYQIYGIKRGFERGELESTKVNKVNKVNSQQKPFWEFMILGVSFFILYIY